MSSTSAATRIEAGSAPAPGWLPPLAVYVHLPFCTKKCDYCAFNSGPVEAALRRRYLDLLPGEFDRFHTRFPHYPRQAYTLFLGGGTPSVLTPDEMERLLTRLLAVFPDPLEFSCEVNPQTANRELLALLRAFGCNRISIGLQTFDPVLLEHYGRAHGVAEFHETYQAVRELGFPQVSFDLLYGHPEQSHAGFARDLDQALALSPTHLSLYGLKVEEHTPFARMGIEARQDPDGMADMFELACARLAEAGLMRYELSNFARPGHQSLHNRAYWELRDWIGFGLEAHSLLRETPEAIPQPFVREKTYSRWFEALESGGDALVPGDLYSAADYERTALIMGLRLTEGVSATAFAERFDVELHERYAPILAPYEQWGLVEWISDDARGLVLRLTGRGAYLSNQVFAALV